MNKISLSTLLFVSLFALKAYAQYEEIVPLKRNNAIINYLNENELVAENLSYKRANSLTLPFFDDFSSTKIYPDKARWQDRTVFINNGFAVNPPSHGVATFDGLNKKGFPYNIDGNNLPKPCDTLTSLPIDLDGLAEGDSLYLSFYYQQKGLGENPESNDSLMLEFKNDLGEWKKQWAVNGQFDSLANFPFLQVLVKLGQSNKGTFFHDSFQFRFRNYGNRTGALDHWHIDYVFLDKGRNAKDTLLEDVSIYQQPKGLFKNYYSMPWRHYREDRNTYKNERIDYNVNNKAATDQSPDIFYTITDVTNNELVYSSFNLRNQLNDVPSYGQKTGSQTNELPFSYFDDLEDQKIKLELKLTTTSRNIVGGPELLKENDVYIMHQYFDDYFAYDDGSAEGGYGLKNTRQGSVALRFSLKTNDTLKYVAFNFTGGNEVLPDQQKFNLVIWEKLFPNPVIIAKRVGLKPVYTNFTNGFALYALEEPLLIGGEFFIGWEQNTSYNLNVGIDLDYRFFNDGQPNPNLFFNAAGQWENSKIVGTPLIRPVFGSDVNLSKNQVWADAVFEIFPNPANDFITIKTENYESSSVSIYNINGQEITNFSIEKGQTTIDLAPYPKGIYLVKLRNDKGAIATKRFIKS